MPSQKLESTFAEELPRAEKHLTKHDRVLRAIIKKHGPCRLSPQRKKPFETLVGSIISQQLSTKAASTIEQRFRKIYAPKRFPTCEQISATDEPTLRACGLSGQKIRYIKDLAGKVSDGSVHLAKLDRMEDDDIIAELTQIKGIGVWTVHMYLIFSLGRLNVLPTGDLGVRSAIKRQYALTELPSHQEVVDLSTSNNWQPYQSIASWYLWRSLENKPD